jgi:hypothetical protein
MAFYPSMQASPMWLLAAAFAGDEGKVRVFDISDLVMRVRATTSSQAPQIRVRAILEYPACNGVGCPPESHPNI